ncbi:MAG: F0F1 ATP synthase subunit A [Dehalococcoidia bacterium]|nr:F0F1 ATP synthase subunit A [Dehalococcoidia bacterium]
MRWLLIGLGVLAFMIVGMVFVGGPPPAIIVAPEAVFHWGPLDVTNTMFTSWLVVGFLLLLGFFVGRNLSLVPSGFSGAVEAAVVAFYGIVVQVAGEKNGRRFFPLVATIFFFILISNYAGLLPVNAVIGVTEPGHGATQAVFQQTNLAGADVAYIPFTPDTVDEADAHHFEEGETPTLDEDGTFSGILAPYLRSVMTDVNAPLAIAIFSFIFVEYWGLSTLGIGYLGKFFSFGRLLRGNPMGIIDAFVGLLELVSELSRIISFTFRLFGNIFAGEVLLLMMTFLVPFVLVNVFYGLELFVGLIQAFVFAMLTLVFAQTAVSHHGGDDSHGEEHGAAHTAAAEGH